MFMKAINHQGDLRDFLESYCYQPDLTKKLDDLSDDRFEQPTINEIVLWKVNRYAPLPEKILNGLDRIGHLKAREHRQAEDVLGALLNMEVKGVDLPIASTLLRFRNPNVFQIIDRHAYRAVYDKRYPLYPSTKDSKKGTVYFDYLDKLWDLCEERGLEFRTIDRLLYEFDKQKNGKL